VDLATPTLLLKDEGPTPDLGVDDEVDEADDEDGARPRIRCPLCMWVPRGRDRWICYCGCSWHTFDTGGRCPECGFQHEHTMCLACRRWSKHLAWYADEGST
jgi:hypothetical protein